MTVRKLFEYSPALTRAELRPYLSPHRLAQLVGKGVLRYDGRIEADGAIGPSGKQNLEFDSIRYTEFAAAGYVLIRVTWPTAMERRSLLAWQAQQAVDHRL